MTRYRTTLTAAGAVLGATLMVTSALAWGGSQARTTYLTFSGAVALPGITLAKGSYIFELAEPGLSADMVRVLDADRRTVYLTAFTQLVPRPLNVPQNKAITFHEAARGVAAPIDIWFPEGESVGHQFIYANR